MYPVSACQAHASSKRASTAGGGGAATFPTTDLAFVYPMAGGNPAYLAPAFGSVPNLLIQKAGALDPQPIDSPFDPLDLDGATRLAKAPAQYRHFRQDDAPADDDVANKGYGMALILRFGNIPMSENAWFQGYGGASLLTTFNLTITATGDIKFNSLGGGAAATIGTVTAEQWHLLRIWHGASGGATAQWYGQLDNAAPVAKPTAYGGWTTDTLYRLGPMTTVGTAYYLLDVAQWCLWKGPDAEASVTSESLWNDGAFLQYSA